MPGIAEQPREEQPRGMLGYENRLRGELQDQPQEGPRGRQGYPGHDQGYDPATYSAQGHGAMTAWLLATKREKIGGSRWRKWWEKLSETDGSGRWTTW